MPSPPAPLHQVAAAVSIGRVEEVPRAAAEAFGLGALHTAEGVVGGLSNDLWQVQTDDGSFAVKAMRVNATSPGFRDNIEAAYAVEAEAFRRGVPCPEPIALPSGRCLGDVEGRLVRVHRWCEGRTPISGEFMVEAGRLIARIQCAGNAHELLPLDDEPWDATDWSRVADHPQMPEPLAARLRDAAPSLAALEQTTAASGLLTTHGPSHGDLDPKNALIVDNQLLALDWDAAGVQPVVREAVSVALDWSTNEAGFAQVLDSYARESGEVIPQEPWVFGGWVSAQGGWLVYNATEEIATEAGRAQVVLACDSLLALHRSFDTYCDVLGSS